MNLTTGMGKGNPNCDSWKPAFLSVEINDNQDCESPLSVSTVNLLRESLYLTVFYESGGYRLSSSISPKSVIIVFMNGIH